MDQALKNVYKKVKIIAQELLKEGLSSENLGLYNDLMWQIQSIEASVDCPNMDEFTVYWVLG